MKTDIELRGLFTYSSNILIILAIIVILPPLIIWVIKLVNILSGKKKKNIKAKKNKKITASYILKLKNKCMSRISEIEKLYGDEAMDYRAAYLELSFIVRDFVQKIAGNNVSNLTLSEIKELSIPELYALIEEFYEPEFAMENENWSENPFDDARKVIERWS